MTPTPQTASYSRRHFTARVITALAALTALTAPMISQAAASAAAAVEEEAPPLRRTPRWLLQGPGGRSVSAEDFRGRFQLLAFGYTGCPDVCPTTMVEMQQLLAALGPQAARLQPVFISVDPERDTPTVLREYAAAFDARILPLSGPQPLLRRAAAAFKVRYEVAREPGALPHIYTVDHTAALFLVGPDGQLLARFIYGTPQAELLAQVKQWLARAER